MDENKDDPWASLRSASSKPDAGRFAYEDQPPERARASALEWIKFWLRVELKEWFKKQFPLAEKSLDSSYYLGFTRQKKTTRTAVRVLMGKEAEKEASRTPVVILGRRIGVPGLILSSLALIVLIYFIRLIFRF